MKPFSRIASFILALVALVHLVRVFMNTQVMIGNFETPMWVSIVAIIITALLSIGLWRESKIKK